MDLREEQSYAAPAAEVFAMLTEPAFLERTAARTGALRWQAAVEDVDDGVRTRLHRVMPPAVPDFVRKFVGDQLDVVEVVTWGPAAADGSRTGDLHVEILKAPVRMTGEVALRPRGVGSVQTIVAHVKASVPFVGGRIEQSAAEAVQLAARKQHQVGQAWLTGDRG